MESKLSRWKYWVFGAIFASAAGLIFVHLGAKPFWDFDESWYANVVHDTQASGDILTLDFNGNPWFEKPPLYFWSSMAIDAVIHNPQWSYRLTAALAGIAAIALVMLIAFEWTASALAAAIAGAVLVTTAPFIDAAREVRLDIPVIATILLAAYCFLRGQRSPRWYLGVGIAVGIGIMFKSVIGLLAGVFILAYSIAYWDLRWLRSSYVWIGAAAGLLVTAPWHLYETAAYGREFWHNYLFYNIIERATSDVLANTASTWTAGGYAMYLVRYAAPWSWVFLALIALYVYERVKGKSADALRPLLTALLCGGLILALFFSAASKLPYYLLPSYPFFALAIALAIDYGAKRFTPATVQKRYVAGALALLLVLGAANTAYFWLHLTPIESASDKVAYDEQQVGLIMAQDPDTPIYTYQYDFWNTIQWYSGRSLHKLQLGETLSQPIYVVIWSKFLEHFSFPPELAPHFKMLYKGPAVTLFYFSP